MLVLISFRLLLSGSQLTPFLSGAKLRQPALFVGVEFDPVIAINRDLFNAMEKTVPDLRKKVLLPSAGHWIQQERPTEVNQLLIEFLTGAA